jgi:AcrR family transcriptional regulator
MWDRSAACADVREDGAVTAADSSAAPRSPRRRGRRPGGADTREALLSAARAEFAERGYDAATVRVIADRAGVDPAMVNHWFGGKDNLFAAALALPMDPSAIVAEVTPGDPENLGERIVTRFLTVWDHTGGSPFAAIVRNVVGHEIAARLMRQLITRVLVARIVESVAPDQSELRGSLVASQLVGLAMVRYVLRLEPLASADHATVVAAIAPTLQRYLTGPLDGDTRP